MLSPELIQTINELLEGGDEQIVIRYAQQRNDTHGFKYPDVAQYVVSQAHRLCANTHPELLIDLTLANCFKKSVTSTMQGFGEFEQKIKSIVPKNVGAVYLLKYYIWIAEKHSIDAKSLVANIENKAEKTNYDYLVFARYLIRHDRGEEAPRMYAMVPDDFNSCLKSYALKDLWGNNPNQCIAELESIINYDPNLIDLNAIFFYLDSFDFRRNLELDIDQYSFAISQLEKMSIKTISDNQLYGYSMYSGDALCRIPGLKIYTTYDREPDYSSHKFYSDINIFNRFFPSDSSMSIHFARFYEAGTVVPRDLTKALFFYYMSCLCREDEALPRIHFILKTIFANPIGLTSSEVYRFALMLRNEKDNYIDEIEGCYYAYYETCDGDDMDKIFVSLIERAHFVNPDVCVELHHYSSDASLFFIASVFDHPEQREQLLQFLIDSFKRRPILLLDLAYWVATIQSPEKQFFYCQLLHEVMLHITLTEEYYLALLEITEKSYYPSLFKSKLQLVIERFCEKHCDFLSKNYGSMNTTVQQKLMMTLQIIQRYFEELQVDERNSQPDIRLFRQSIVQLTQLFPVVSASLPSDAREASHDSSKACLDDLESIKEELAAHLHLQLQGNWTRPAKQKAITDFFKKASASGNTTIEADLSQKRYRECDGDGSQEVPKKRKADDSARRFGT